MCTHKPCIQGRVRAYQANPDHTCNIHVYYVTFLALYKTSKTMLTFYIMTGAIDAYDF